MTGVSCKSSIEAMLLVLLQLPSSKDKEAAKFAQIWNKIITSLRGEDLINNREMNLLLAPQFVDRELDLIQWPLFLLAGKKSMNTTTLPIIPKLQKQGNESTYDGKVKIKSTVINHRIGRRNQICKLVDCNSQAGGSGRRLRLRNVDQFLDSD
ncbi:hypothetical protein R6Q59_014730 [Mikania micrantha]